VHDYRAFLQEFEEFRIRARHLFEGRHLAASGSGLACAGEWAPAVDVYDTGDAIVLAAEIAGVGREDVGIEVAGSVLTLRGTRPCGRAGAAPESYLRMEVPTGSFERSFRLPWPARGHLLPLAPLFHLESPPIKPPGDRAPQPTPILLLVCRIPLDRPRPLTYRSLQPFTAERGGKAQ
jgi:HSP20 family molecular chaperone IbpA